MIYELLPGSDFPRDCIVPVHKNICHRENIQPICNAAGTNLLAARYLTCVDLDHTCLESFYRGDLNRAIFLREYQRRKFGKAGDKSESYKNLLFGLNPLAGSALAERVIRKRPEWLNGKLYAAASPDSQLLVSAGNILVNCDLIQQGWERYRAVEGELPRWRKKNSRLYPLFKRRIGVVTSEIADSEDALTLALAGC
jgi:hypothetical protein